MILPDKYVPYEKSIVYYSDLVLGIIMNMKEAKTIEIIWNRFKKVHKSISFSDFYNSVLLLAMLNLIIVNKESDLIEVKKVRNNRL
jgi:hypothetical protein